LLLSILGIAGSLVLARLYITLRRKEMGDELTYASSTFIQDIIQKLERVGFEFKDYPQRFYKQKITLDEYAVKDGQEYAIEMKNTGRYISEPLLNNLKRVALMTKRTSPKIKLILITKEKIVINETAKKMLADFNYVLDANSIEKTFLRK